MIGQIFLTGRLSAEPEISLSKKGKPIARILLDVDQVRPTPAGPQSEQITLPVILFSRQAEAIQAFRKGDPLWIAAHLNGTRFEAPDGTTRHGTQLVADSVLTESKPTPSGAFA